MKNLLCSSWCMEACFCCHGIQIKRYSNFLSRKCFFLRTTWYTLQVTSSISSSKVRIVGYKRAVCDFFLANLTSVAILTSFLILWVIKSNSEWKKIISHNYDFNYYISLIIATLSLSLSIYIYLYYIYKILFCVYHSTSDSCVTESSFNF